MGTDQRKHRIIPPLPPSRRIALVSADDVSLPHQHAASDLLQLSSSYTMHDGIRRIFRLRALFFTFNF